MWRNVKNGNLKMQKWEKSEAKWNSIVSVTRVRRKDDADVNKCRKQKNNSYQLIANSHA